MLDMGFIPDIKRILAVLPPKRQNLLFSATFPEEVRRLAKELLREPVTVEVAPRNAPADLVTHLVYPVPTLRKRALLTHLIRSRDMRQVLVFVRMKRDANRLARQLKHDGVFAREIHSDRTQAERMEALQEFKQGRVPVLVATDIAARGLDIEELPFVINYELPHAAEDYVHRIGRTGRAGMPGEAISLVGPEEAKFLEDIERLLKRKLPRADLPERLSEGRMARDPRAMARVPGPRRDGENAGARALRHAPATPAPRPQAHASDFDFSKPYEPASSAAQPAPAPTPPQSRGRQQRPTPALLGGSVKREPHKS
jgi:ATP-dependent RNA helicase RhlE